VPAAQIHAASDLPARHPLPMCNLETAMKNARDELFKRFKTREVRSEARKVKENLGSRDGPLSWRGRTEKKNKKTPKTPKSLFDPD